MTTLTLPRPRNSFLDRLRTIRLGLGAPSTIGYALSQPVGGGAAAGGWWLLDGRTCQRAYDPYNAASLAASYSNLANPGTGDATGTAPTWSATSGWIFNGLNQYLTSGVVPVAGQTTIMHFTHAAAEGYVGSGEAPDKRHYMVPYRNYQTGYHEYGFGSGAAYQQVSPRLIHGILTMTTSKGYRDKVNDASKTATTLPSTAMWIGAMNAPTWGSYFASIRIRQWATWAEELSGIEISTLVDRLWAFNLDQTAYVETTGNDSTGVLDDAAHPYLTLNGALDALAVERRGTIQIGAGTFAPIAGDTSAATTKLHNHLILRGAGAPTVKGDLSGLEGGTIIQGPLVIDRDSVELYDLGIDSGSTVCAALYGGAAQDVLSVVNIGQVVGKPARAGLVVKRVTTICAAPDSLNHAALFENVTGAVIEDITTALGAHGIVFKATNTTATRLNTLGHIYNGLIIKSNTYAPCHDVTVTDVIQEGLSFGGGIVFAQNDAGAPDLLDVNIAGVVHSDVAFGVHYAGATSGSNYIRRCNVASLSGSSIAVTKSGNVADCYVNGTPV